MSSSDWATEKALKLVADFHDDPIEHWDTDSGLVYFVAIGLDEARGARRLQESYEKLNDNCAELATLRAERDSLKATESRLRNCLKLSVPCIWDEAYTAYKEAPLLRAQLEAWRKRWSALKNEGYSNEYDHRGRMIYYEAVEADHPIPTGDTPEERTP